MRHLFGMLAILLAAPGPTILSAQVQRPSSASTSDSVAWERILIYVVSSLSTHQVRTSTDASLQPWTITLPQDEPQRELLEARLRTILRARPVAAEDSVTYELEIGPLVLTNDTARVTVRTDFANRCAGSDRSGGYGNVDRVFVVRGSRGFWGVARTAGVAHGVRVGC